ncbi:MAG: rhodanese-like domain-containing protein [Bacteroidia bacterium]
MFNSYCLFSNSQKSESPALQTGVILLSPADFQKKLNTAKGILLDVRTPQEFKKGHLKGARLLNIFDDTFDAEINKLDKKQTYFVYCQSGGRSAEACEMMRKKGFFFLYDMDGGFGKWKLMGLPSEQ